MKIFQIGFNKCGTRSISTFFKRHVLRTTDWAHGDLAKSIKSDVEAGQPPLGQWTETDVFSDMEYVHAVRMIECQRRSKNRPNGGAKVDHLGGRDGPTKRWWPVDRAPQLAGG